MYLKNYAERTPPIGRTAVTIALLLSVICNAGTAAAQELIQNGTFDNGATFWNTTCTNVEANNNETTYGGTVSTNHVAEVDDGACLYQDVCVLPGMTYAFNMKASRRTANGAASPTVTTYLKIIGLDAGNAVVGSPYVNMIFSRSNTTFSLTPVTGIPTFSIPISAGVVRLRISLTDSTPGYSTLGMIVDDLSLMFTSPPVLNGADTVCQGTSGTTFGISGLPASGIYYTWSFGANATPATSTAANPSVSWSITGAKQVSCILSNGSCNVTTVSKTVQVYIPLPPAVISPVKYCTGATATPLTATGTNPQWYTTATGGTPLGAAPTPSTAVAGVTTYYVSSLAGPGCESQRLPITVMVTDRPPPPIVTTPVTYCMNAPAMPLTAIGNSLPLLWYYTPLGGNGTGTPPVPSTWYIDTTTYWVTQTDNGCESLRSKLDVYVHHKSNGIIIGSKTELCQYDTASFSYFGNAYPSSQYDWKSPLGATTILSGMGQGSVVIRFDSVGTQKIRLQINDSGCVSDPAFFNVNVKPAPVFRTAIPKEACVGQSVYIGLSYVTAGVDNYSWNFDGGNVLYGATGGGPYGVSWNTAGDHYVTLVASAVACPSRMNIDTITIHALPYAHIDGLSSTQICADDRVTLSANNADSGCVYAWSPAAYFGGFANAGPVTTAQITYPGYISLKITDRYGCVGEDSTYVNAAPCCTVALPDAFTPNGDGRNDYFRIITKGNHKISTFRVVNRWGQVVFETADETQGWDGSVNGVQQDMGVYYYYIKYHCVNGENLEQKGEVTLIR